MTRSSAATCSLGTKSRQPSNFQEGLHLQLDSLRSTLHVLHQHEVATLHAEIARLQAEPGRQSNHTGGFQLQEDGTAGMTVMEERSCIGTSTQEQQPLTDCLMLEAIGVRAFSDEGEGFADFIDDDIEEAAEYNFFNATSDTAMRVTSQGPLRQQSPRRQQSPHRQQSKISDDGLNSTCVDALSTERESKIKRLGTEERSHVLFDFSEVDEASRSKLSSWTPPSKFEAISAFEIRDSWLTMYEQVAKLELAGLFSNANVEDVKIEKGMTRDNLSMVLGPEFRPVSLSMRRLMVAPDSKIRLAWFLASMVVLLYDMITVPIDVSFNLGPEMGTPLGILQFIGRCFWTVDIIMTFFIGLTIDDVVVMDPGHVAKKYICSWFFFDTSLVTFEWVSFGLIEKPASSASVLRGARAARIVRMGRLLRLARVAKLKLALSEVIVLSSDGLRHVAHFLTVTAAVAVAIHLSACCWHFLGTLLPNGWVERCGFSSAPIASRYAMAFHEVLLHSHTDDCSRDMGTLESLLDCSMLLACIVISAWYIGIACLTVTAYANSDESQLQKIAEQYIKRHNISRKVRRRLRKFQSAQHMEGLGERLAAEARLFSVLPASLQEDLTSEARCPILRTYQCIADLKVISPRVEIHLCNQAVSNLLAIEGELVFALGDACSQMLFVMQGELRYFLNGSARETSLIDRGPSMASDSRMPASATNDSAAWHYFHHATSHGASRLRDGIYLCEPVLWTHWEHCGELVAQRDSLMLSMRANDFINVIMQHRTAYVYAVKYARYFIWHLNRMEPSDVLDLHVSWTNLDDDLFTGDEEDHFMFISHYKEEAGTEATLMRDALDRLIKDDPRHHASDLISPVFIDSEDLTDLSQLMTHVERSTVLLLLLTPGVLTRPWCVLEIVTALRNSVQIVPIEIQRPGIKYAYPDEEFYLRLRNGQMVPQDGIQLLEKQGVTMQEVEDAIRQVFLKIALPFSPHKSGNIRQAELQDILARSGDPPSAKDSASRKTMQVTKAMKSLS